MALEFEALDAKELVLVVVAILGLLPVVTQRTERSGLFTLGYVLLCFGAVVTNLEHVVLGDVLGQLEHAVGVAGAGVVFAYAAYRRRGHILRGDEQSVGDDAAAGDGAGVAGGVDAEEVA
ncbi:hypothetical protein [Halobaculum sp. P14]|uniref:hypothetical protein n=1 Tax=Halobaculum sp. P14 TaxID=3421638 RepID=UPI003EBEAD9A